MTGVQRQTPQFHVEVRRRLEADESADLIADELKVGKTTIYRWAHSAGWKPDAQIAGGITAKKQGRSLSKRNAAKRGDKPSVARTLLEETHDIGLVASRLGVSKTAAYAWAHSSGWIPDSVEVRAKRQSERLITPGLDISTPRYCPTCDKQLELKRFPSDGRWERPYHFARRQYCDRKCKANFGLPKYDRFCEFCQKLLVRRQYSTGLEKPKHFAERRFCGHRCAANHPDKKYAAPWATQLALDSPYRIPALRAACRTPEHRALMRDVHLDREKQFSPDEIIEIRAAKGSGSEIAAKYSTSPAMVTMIKKGDVYQHVPPSPTVLLVYSSQKGRNNSKPRRFSDDNIRNICADKRENKVIAIKWGISRSMVEMIKKRTVYCYVEVDPSSIFIFQKNMSGANSPVARQVLVGVKKFPTLTSAAKAYDIPLSTAQSRVRRAILGWKYI